MIKLAFAAQEASQASEVGILPFISIDQACWSKRKVTSMLLQLLDNITRICYRQVIAFVIIPYLNLIL